MFNITKAFYILDDQDRIIILEPDIYEKDSIEASKFDISYHGENNNKHTAHIFFNSLKENEYIKIPVKNGFVKINMKDNLIKKLLLNNKFNNLEKNSFKILIRITSDPIIKEKIFQDIFQLPDLLKDKNHSLISNLKNILKDNICNISYNLKNNAIIKEKHYYLKKDIFKEDKYTIDNYSEKYKMFIIKSIDFNIKNNGYYNRFKGIQYIIDAIVFSNFDKYKALFINIIENSSSDEYDLTKVPLYQLAVLSDDELMWLHTKSNKTYTIMSKVRLEILKRNIRDEHYFNFSRSDMLTIDRMFNDFKAWPKDYEMAIIRILSKFNGMNEFMEDYKRIMNFTNNFDTSDTLNTDYFNYNNSAILGFISDDKRDLYTFEYIHAYYTARVTEPNYSSVFANDIIFLKYSDIGTREGDFSMLTSLLFRPKPSDNYSDILVQAIIDKGVASLIGSSDSYAVRTRMVRAFACLVHEKERPAGFIATDDNHLKYFMETLSNSKLRGTLLAKMFNTPKMLDTEISKRWRMKDNQFFGKSYSDFMLAIDDIEYREDLNDVVLLLALS